MNLEMVLHTLLYIGVGFLLYMLGVVLFALTTKVKEKKEIIENGNTAIAIKLAGKLLGLGIVIYAASTNSTSIWDMIAWGLFGIVAQIVGYLFIELILFPKVSLVKKVEEKNIAVAIMLMAASIVIGLSIAGAISYDPTYELIDIIEQK